MLPIYSPSRIFYQLKKEQLLKGCGMEAIARSEARTISVQPDLWLNKET
ncbi:MAG: hypothetical protein ABI358_07500 [Ginsengibacter sp.]